MRPRRLLPWIPLIVAGSALAWIVVVVATGGLVIRTPWLRLSSRDALRPFLVLLLAGLWYVVRFRGYWRVHADAVARLPLPAMLAGAAAVWAVGVAVTQGTFAAGGSDSSGYVSQADMWAHGELTKAVPVWAADAPWRDATFTSAPLGYRPDAENRRLVPTYAAGLPLLMAAFQLVAGHGAVYYVVPLLGGLAVWLTYLLGALLWSKRAGAVASIWLVTSPAFLWMVVQPMSDVAACAFWTLALVAACSTSARPLLAGVGASAAILTRPNLAPLSLIVGALLAARSGMPPSRVKRVVLFVATTLPSILCVGLLNSHLHGSPLRSGYGATETLYAAGNIVPNLQYLRWLAESQTPLVFGGLLAPLLAPARVVPRRLVHVLAGVVFPAAVLCAYLPYSVFEDWSYVRFLLPAYPPLLVGLAGLLTALPGRLRPVVVGTVLVAAVAVAVAWRNAEAASTYGAFGLDTVEARYLEAAGYVKNLPTNAVIASVNHSGSVSYYTGRDVLRWDLLDPLSMDTAIAYLERRGHPVYLLTDRPELHEFQRRFQGAAALGRLVPAATFSEGVVVFETTPEP